MQQHVKTIMLRLVITLPFRGNGLVQFNGQKIFVFKSSQRANYTSKNVSNFLPWKNVFMQVDLAAIIPGTET